jgi:hypothetical protein
MLTSGGSACQGGIGGIGGIGDSGERGGGGGDSAEVVVALQITTCLVRALINSSGSSSSVDQAAAVTGTSSNGNSNQEYALVMFPSDLREDVIGGLYKLLVVFGISTGCELLAAAHLQVCSSSSSSSSGPTYPDWVERVKVSASAGDAKKFRSALKTLYVQYVK